MAPPSQVPAIPTYTGPPRQIGMTQTADRTNDIRAHWDLLNQSMQTIPDQLVPQSLSPSQGQSHPGPPSGGSALLNAIMRRMQALQQGAYAQQQARIQAGPRFVSPLAHAGLRAGIYDRNLTDPVTGAAIPRGTQIANHYRGNVTGSLANTGGVYDPNLPPGTPGNTLMGTAIPAAFQNAVMGNPLLQQISMQAAINSGHIPPPQPWPAPAPAPAPSPGMAPFPGVNPNMPLGPMNVSPGAPGTQAPPPGSGTTYPPQYGPPQTYGQQY